ncbi:hypothetical protein [Amycolatopsis plumensis]|uniref:Secreted protein n=1 Tax=Amycolatopsis plumensis TaxID=236508 RepID=A0ABV5U796_9PSEU
MLLVVLFLRCYAFSSSTGRHALGVDVDSGPRCVGVGCDEAGEVASVSVGGDIIDQCGNGLAVDDDFPTDLIGARPYLEEYWRTSGCHLVDQTVEFAAPLSDEKDDEYRSVSGQLELVA